MASMPQQISVKPAGRGLARSATVLAVGNVVSRLFGLLREMVITSLFGPSGLVSAFTIASQVPALLYDLLIGGMLSAALVPVLSDYARPERRADLIRLVGALVSLLGVILAGLVLVLALAAPQIAWLMAAGFEEVRPDLLPLTTRLIRLMAPAVWLFSMAGLLTAILYALQRFTFPAAATAVYNLGIVLLAPLLAPSLGIASLAVGILVGSLAQFLLMAWDLHRSGLRLQLQWSHPAVRKIWRLYLPVAAGLVVAQLQIILDRRLASGTGEQSIAWMRTATTLQQLPLGLISVAISLAALPRLSQHFAAQDEVAYRRTLARGLRMVLLLIVPALVGLWLLGEPVVRLLFERRLFLPGDTLQVAHTLRVYLVGALFAAVDFPLNYAFYARQNTLLPATVGVLSTLIYVAVAFLLLEGMGYLGLVWADTAKQAGHATIMLALLLWQVGRLRAHMGRGLLSIATGAGAMAGVTAWLSGSVAIWLPAGKAGDLMLLALAGGGGLFAYLGVLALMGLPELRELGRLAGGRLFSSK